MFSTYIVLCYLKFIYIVLHLHVTSYTLTQCVKNIVKLIYTYIQWSFACSRIEIFAKLTYIPLPGLNFQKPKYPYPICIFSDFFFIYSYLGDVRKSVHPPNKTSIYPYPYDPLPWIEKFAKDIYSYPGGIEFFLKKSLDTLTWLAYFMIIFFINTSLLDI
jgi:hypothetical protein